MASRDDQCYCQETTDNSYISGMFLKIGDSCKELHTINRFREVEFTNFPSVSIKGIFPLTRMKRKELEIIYGFGADKIRELLRQAGIRHRKELLEDDIKLFIKVVGKPVKASQFERIFDRL